MDKPIIANNAPITVQVEKDKTYYICTCGRSKDQPFCDGSHSGTSFSPKAFTPDEDGEAWLCACKHSNNFPFCDGSHKQFSDDQVGTEG